jgi:cytochrome c5
MNFRNVCVPAGLRLLAVSLLAGSALAACGQQQAGSPSTSGAPTAATVAASPAVQKLYDTSCKSCHAVPASGAPQTGDAKAWAPRVAQGLDTLLDHAINGYKGMPPMGMCPQCSEDDFTALIEYMSGRKLQ